MRIPDFSSVIREAWEAYNPKKKLVSIDDISARVSTNHVYKITFENGHFVLGKLSYFGKYEHFREDHTIIHTMANNLLYPFENFLGKSLMKDGQVFTYRSNTGLLDVWVVFYNPIRTMNRPPRILNIDQIKILGRQLALFHQACEEVSSELPPSSKTPQVDINHLLKILDTDFGKFEYRQNEEVIRDQCAKYLENERKLNYDQMIQIPVFVDWNIGNFSVNNDFEFFSRWDYDWFRIGSRVFDFYFFSRVCSTIGDRTVFSYVVDPLMEERFLIFLKEYHSIFPLTAHEILYMREAYRFFILNYVIKDGRYFFHEMYASKLQKETYDLYFPQLERKFTAERILKALKL